MYNEQKTEFNDLLTNTKAMHYTKRIEQFQGDPRRQQKVIDEILGKSTDVKLPSHDSLGQLVNC
jgi:hypothetical protein